MTHTPNTPSYKPTLPQLHDQRQTWPAGSPTTLAAFEALPESLMRCHDSLDVHHRKAELIADALWLLMVSRENRGGDLVALGERLRVLASGRSNGWLAMLDGIAQGLVGSERDSWPVRVLALCRQHLAPRHLAVAMHHLHHQLATGQSWFELIDECLPGHVPPQPSARTTGFFRQQHRIDASTVFLAMPIEVLLGKDLNGTQTTMLNRGYRTGWAQLEQVIRPAAIRDIQQRADQLERMLSACPEISIVLSTRWRRYLPDIEEMVSIVGPALGSRVVGMLPLVTERVWGWPQPGVRAQALDRWLAAAGCHNAPVTVVDEEPIFWHGSSHKLVHLQLCGQPAALAEATAQLVLHVHARRARAAANASAQTCGR